MAADETRGGHHRDGRSRSGRRIVFLGPPNSGKGTQAQILAKKLGIPAISTGQMLRDAVAAGNDLGLRVKDVMERGELVSDELMTEVVKERLARDDAADGFLLDGYPRTAAQAEALAELGPVRDVVLIKAPQEVLLRRALARGRSDDREEIVRERLRVYEEQTAPLVEHYEKLGLLRRIDGDRTIEEVGRALESALGEV